jgi:hypothetical protein
MKRFHQRSRYIPCAVTLESKSFCLEDRMRSLHAAFLTLHRVILIVAALALSGSCLTTNAEEPRFVDHSLLIAPE